MATAPSVTSSVPEKGHGPGTSKAEAKPGVVLEPGEITNTDHSAAQKAVRENSGTAQNLDKEAKQGSAKSKVPDPGAPPAKALSGFDKGTVETGAVVYVDDNGQRWEPVACAIHAAVLPYELKPRGFQPDCALCHDQMNAALQAAKQYGTF